MVDKERLLELLPLNDQVVLKEERQDTGDIRAELLAAHKEYAPDYDKIYAYFDQGNIIDSSRGIFDFLKQNVPYKKENGRHQTIKSPAAILTYNRATTNYDRVDCKNYASFIGGILDAIKRNNPDTSWDWCYRFASYQENDPEPGHVFVVVKIDDKELWIDPVFSYFNEGTLHEWEIDEKPAIGGLYRISGPPEINSNVTVTVNAQKAAQSFLVAVQMNLFNLPFLLINYPDITMKQVKPALEAMGVNWRALLYILKYVQSK